jgi:hypothetical protein
LVFFFFQNLYKLEIFPKIGPKFELGQASNIGNKHTTNNEQVTIRTSFLEHISGMGAQQMIIKKRYAYSWD